MCGIVTVKLKQNITRNLPIELVCEIVSFTYKFKHQLKFQPVLQDIEDGTMCVSNSNITYVSKWYIFTWACLLEIGHMVK